MDKFYAGKKILVIRLSSLGDIIRLVPSMETVNRTFGKVVFLTEDRFASVLDLYPMAPEVILFPRKNLGFNSLRTFLKNLKENDFDLILDMHGIFKSAFISGLATGKESAGFARGFGKEFSHLFYNKKLVCGRSSIISRYERYEGALRALGIEPGETQEYYPPRIDENASLNTGKFLKDNGLSESGYILLFLGASKKQSFKRWPLSRFEELSLLIKERFGLKSVLGWGPDENEMKGSIRAGGHMVVPPLLSLQETAALIMRAEAFVGVDTGLMHLAALAGVRTVAVMGATDPVLNRPWGKRSSIVFKDRITRGCGGADCSHDACMGQITAEEVFAGLKSLLGR